MKRIITFLSILSIITLLASPVFASVTSKFEIVEDNICTIKLNENCTFEKRMIDYDLNKRQVTIQLKITNDAILNKPTGEVMLVLDRSESMLNPETAPDEQKRGTLVYESAKKLIEKMLSDNDKLKVGLVDFSTSTVASEEGTMSDATLASELTNDIASLTNKINTIQSNIIEKKNNEGSYQKIYGTRTDLEAGLTLAGQYFSNENTNKYIIVLTDGVPNVALNYDKIYYSDDVVNKTKSKIISLAEQYNLITMLTGVAEDDVISSSTYPFAKDMINAIWGTTENPTAGKFYYITDDQIEETVKESIYKDLLPTPQSITNININDYFPKEIVDNFNFAYLSQPTKGTISPSIDEENKIVWSLDELASGETATVQYTLTLKDNYDPNIVNVILDTNEKVDITYKDFDGNDSSKTSTDTPKVRITEITKSDPTVAPTIIPKAGSTATITLIILALTIATISGIKYIRTNKEIKK